MPVLGLSCVHNAQARMRGLFLFCAGSIFLGKQGGIAQKKSSFGARVFVRAEKKYRKNTLIF